MKRMLAGICSFLLLFSVGCTPAAPEPSSPTVASPAPSSFSTAPGDGLQPVNAVSYPSGISFDDLEREIALREDNPVSDAFIESMLTFSYETAAQTFGLTDGNTNYSPISLYYALALAATGAQGETLDELLSLLGVSDIEALTVQCGNLFRRLYTNSEYTQLKLANSLWLAEAFQGQPITFQDAFLLGATESFYASTFLVDFAKDETGSAMGNWISQQTNGTLSPTIQTDPQQILSILNTVYFKDEWTSRFNADLTAPDTFYLSDGSEVTCDFLNATYGSYGFAIGDGFSRAAFGLKGGNAMVFILPDEGSDMDALLSSASSIRALFEEGEYYSGELIFKAPKFSVQSKLDLGDPLKALGVTSAFEETADFSAMSDQAACLSSVSQETYISIDENGVEASAYTELAYAGSAMPTERLELILDRPFIYGITTGEGVLLFVGVCENPVE